MKKVRCPICERDMAGSGPKDWPQWPFCSERCKVVDLGRWLSGGYRIESPLREEHLAAEDELESPPKPAVPSAVPHREEA
jgi:endogenous inhibitor of DNA gyrase (YacG/DUF329 family)